MDIYLIWTLQSTLPLDLSVEYHSSLNCLHPAGILVPSSDESLTTAVLKNSHTEIPIVSNIWA